MTILPLREPIRVACTAVMLLGVSVSARAQSLPSEPLVFGGGRVAVSGDVTATVSCSARADAAPSTCRQDPGFFNYTDYQHSILRMLRMDLSASVRAGRHVSVLGDIRSENGSSPRPYGLYVRVRPWTERDVDIQVGRIPPTFGAFARRSYASDNVLIGYPLAYQYLVSLRPNAIPRNADELLAMRGRGWESNFSVGNLDREHGLPIASAFRWDTGIQVHGGSDLVEAAASVTVGSLGNPRVRDDNDGKQVAGRVAVRPVPGLVIGASGSRGAFLTRDAVRAATPPDEDANFAQTALGGDVEYSRDYYLVRAEVIISNWALPLTGTPAIHLPLRAVATSIEGRYKFAPRFYGAARLDLLGFSTITGSTRTDEWEAPVSRIEVGGGYSIQRNLQLKLSVQHNRRDGGRVRQLNIGAAQLVFWF